MKKTLIALALTSMFAAPAFAFEIEDYLPGSGGGGGDPGGGVTVICSLMCQGGGTGLMPGDIAPMPNQAPPREGAPPPPPPPPPDKSGCVGDCSVNRTIANNKCEVGAAQIFLAAQNRAIAAQRAKLGASFLKKYFDFDGVPDYVLADIEREVATYKATCGMIAANTETACLEACKTKFGWFLPLLLVRRRREE